MLIKMKLKKLCNNRKLLKYQTANLQPNLKLLKDYMLLLRQKIKLNC
jgi:hypothetical protein